MPTFTAFIPGVGRIRKQSSVTLTHAWAVQYKGAQGGKGHATGWATTQAIAARFAQAKRLQIAEDNPLGTITDVNVVTAQPVERPVILQPPDLDIDEPVLGNRIGTIGKLDRRVTWNLLARLADAGFTDFQVNDGEDITPCADPKAVMELAFNLDDCHVYIRKPGDGKWNWVRLVFGNSGWDVVSDYSASGGEFQALVDDFDGEDYT